MCRYQIIVIAQYLLQYCHRLKFPIIFIFSYCIISRKTEEQGRVTLMGGILLKLSWKCQLTFFTPKEEFSDFISTFIIINKWQHILLYFYIGKLSS